MSNINIVCLGGASEVGRSCVIIECDKTSVMLDCGIHPAFMGIGCLPIYDAYDISKVDLCLITHFHMDHSGALPYLINKTRFKGRIFMTEATKSICYLLWNDYARIEKYMNVVNKNKLSKNKKGGEDENGLNNGNMLLSNEYSSDENIDDNGDVYENNDNGDGNSNVLYDENDIDKTMDLIETLNFHQNFEFPNVKFTAYRAGHVIGACMFLVEINNIRFLYTGDYSREIDRHIPIAEIPNIDVHVLICEGTYGIKVHDDRKKREIRFLNILTSMINNKGKVLLPVFALGRAQELLLILEEHWDKNKHLQNIPIFYISSMATKSLCIYETFINLCGEFVKKVVNEGKNPFNFKYVKYAKSLESISSYLYQDNNPCVIMASPGMLQNGISKNIFNIIASDKKSGVILTGYTVKGTLADELKTEPEFVTINDKVVKRKCRFEQISFSAHSDFNQTKTFIEKLKCPNVVLVHGDKNELNRLKNKLIEEKQYLSVFTPELLQKLSFHFEQNDSLISLGKLSEHIKKINKKIKLEGLKMKKEKMIANDEHISVKNEMGDINNDEENLQISDKKKNKVDEHDKHNINNNISNEKHNVNNQIEGIIITEPQNVPILIYPNDIYEYTNLKTAMIDQTINISFPYRFDLLYNVIINVYEETHMDDNLIIVKDIKIIYCKDDKMIKINWLSSPLNDLIADSINFLILEFLETMNTNQNSIPIADVLTDHNIYEMIISYVEENFTNVERISKEILKEKTLQMIKKKEQLKLKNNDNENSQNFKDDNVCEDQNVEDSNTNNIYLDEQINLFSYDQILFDYISKIIAVDLKQHDEINEILKFNAKDNNNNDVQVFVDMDNREIICKDQNILTKVRKILRNIEESLLPMCF